MGLEGRRRRFQHDAGLAQAQGFRAVDRQFHRSATPPLQNLVVDRSIALLVRHMVQGQIPVAQGRQNPDQRHGRPQSGGDSLTALPEFFEVGVHPPQRVAAQRQRRSIQLDIEHAQFRHHQRIAQPFQETLIERCRLALGVHQPRLDLEAADAANRCEPSLPEPVRQRGCFLAQPQPKPAEVPPGELVLGNFLAHESPSPDCLPSPPNPHPPAEAGSKRSLAHYSRSRSSRKAKPRNGISRSRASANTWKRSPISPGKVNSLAWRTCSR